MQPKVAQNQSERSLAGRGPRVVACLPACLPATKRQVSIATTNNTKLRQAERVRAGEESPRERERDPVETRSNRILFNLPFCFALVLLFAGFSIDFSFVLLLLLLPALCATIILTQIVIVAATAVVVVVVAAVAVAFCIAIFSCHMKNVSLCQQETQVEVQQQQQQQQHRQHHRHRQQQQQQPKRLSTVDNA